MKRLRPYLGVVVGLALLTALIAETNFAQLVQTLETGGRELLWLIPYRSIFFLLYAIGWLLLLRSTDTERRASLRYLFWVTTVREAVDRLLPVASVGGSVVGVRLLRFRKIAVAAASASVIIEIVLTLIASYVFTALGLALLVRFDWGHQYRQFLVLFMASLPIPVVTVLLLRFGGVFERLHAYLPRLIGNRISPAAAAAVDVELRTALHRKSNLAAVAALQLAALICGSFEVWFAMRLFGHPVTAGSAIALESMTQAVRHLAFMIPGGLGVQEAGLVFFGHLLGIGGEMALAVSMAKRLREIAWGLPALISWQWMEGRRVHRMVPDETV